MKIEHIFRFKVRIPIDRAETLVKPFMDFKNVFDVHGWHKNRTACDLIQRTFINGKNYNYLIGPASLLDCNNVLKVKGNHFFVQPKQDYIINSLGKMLNNVHTAFTDLIVQCICSYLYEPRKIKNRTIL
eukprot:UN32410